jgi:cytidine deaminase
MMIETITEDWQKLLAQAKQAAQRAHAPYSKLHVGAAILTTDGAVYSGCNIENASYGATLCAERSALATMISAVGLEARIRAIAVWCSDKNPCYPCGICRQALLPWCDKGALLVVENADGSPKTLPFADLLPYPFTDS